MLKCRKALQTHILWIALAIAVWGGYIISGSRCPVSRVLGIPCPTCGVTRALTALLQGNFEGYLRYHALALILVFAVVAALHIKLVKNQAVAAFLWAFVIGTLIFNLIYYVVRLQNGTLFALLEV